MKITTYLLLLLLSTTSYAAPTGRWFSDSLVSDKVEKALRRDFSYYNQKRIQYLDRDTYEVVAIRYIKRPLTPEQLAYIHETVAIVPLAEIVELRELPDRFAITYSDGTVRSVLKETELPIQATNDNGYQTITMAESGETYLIIETIHTSGTTAMETIWLSDGELCAVTVVTSPRLATSLVLRRYYTSDPDDFADTRKCA